jgi:hypothetical protein
MKTIKHSVMGRFLVRGLFLGVAIMLWGHYQYASAQWSTNGTNVFYNGGNVGIGTTSPCCPLSVIHSSAHTTSGSMDATDLPLAVRNTSNTNNNFSLLSFQDSTGWGNALIGAQQMDQTNHSGELVFYTRNAGTGGERMRIDKSGNVGIGTTSPAMKLHIVGFGAGTAPSWNAADNFLLEGSTTFAIQQFLTGATGQSVIEFSRAGASPSRARGYLLYDNSNDYLAFGLNGASEKMRIDSGGNVGIGTTSPASGYKLDVNGSTNVTGNLNVTGNIAAKYQDVAEWVPSTEQIPAGTVVVLDSSRSNQVITSTEAYDTRVAGVVSEQPGIALGERGKGKVLVATTGRVLVKVDASKGPIHIGDLLVTSEIPGFAMKSEPITIGNRKFHTPGTLIGKALESMEKGSGKILVLLSLQ